MLENDEEGESSGLMKDLDRFSRETPGNSPSISSKANTPTPEPSSSHDGLHGAEDDKSWPSVVDLNTRLRRVITTYQRNVNKKDDVKTSATKGKQNEPDAANHSGGSNPLMDSSLNMQGWDLQQLAMYLLVSVGCNTS